MRVTYANIEQADQAKKMLHGIEFKGSEIGVYLVQVLGKHQSTHMGYGAKRRVT